MDVLSNIRVVPHFPSNDDLARRIREKLAEFIDDTTYRGKKLPPEIIIFRPSGRPGDEFEEAVSPLIGKSSSSVYLLVAFSGQAKDISTLVPYRLKDRVRITEPIFIQSGHLIPSGSSNFEQNKKAFGSVSAVLCTDYDLRMRCGMVPRSFATESGYHFWLNWLEFLMALVLFPVKKISNFLWNQYRSLTD